MLSDCLWRAGAGTQQLGRALSRRLAREAVQFVDAAYHDKRGADSSTAVKWWLRWCRALGIQPVMRASVFDGLRRQRWVESRLILFATWLRRERGVAARTVGGYVSTVMAWHKRRYGSMLPQFEPVRLRAALKGMRVQSVGVVSREHKPVTPVALAAAVRAVWCMDDVDVVSGCAAMVAAFCGLLRVSEYCVTAQRPRFDGAVLPRVQDLQLSTGSATFYVSPRKKGAKAVGKVCPVVLRDGVVLEPVALLRHMRALRLREGSWRKDAPLFRFQGRAMSETAVNRLLRAALAAASVQRAETFSSHSLRVGGATAAMAVGVDPESIKALGRWDSSAYKAYTRLSQQAARRLGVAVASAVVDF